jgi:hypothetical protein
MRTSRILAATVAIAALAVPAAQAEPPDMHPSTAQAAAGQQRAAQAQPPDMHASTAQAAARQQQAAQDLRSRDAREPGRPTLPGAPVWPAHPQPIAHATQAQPTTSDTGPGVDWLPIAVGAAISLIAMTTLATLNSRRMRRLHRARVTV